MAKKKTKRGRGRPSGSRYTEQLRIVIDPPLLNDLKAAAESRGVKVSELVRDAIKRAIAQNPS